MPSNEDIKNSMSNQFAIISYTPKYVDLKVLSLATWRYERNPHATGFLKSDEITELKDLNLHKSR